MPAPECANCVSGVFLSVVVLRYVSTCCSEYCSLFDSSEIREYNRAITLLPRFGGTTEWRV